MNILSIISVHVTQGERTLGVSSVFQVSGFKFQISGFKFRVSAVNIGSFLLVLSVYM